MKFCKNITVFIGLAIFLIPTLASAQWYNRLEVGYSYVVATGVYQGNQGVYDSYGNLLSDSAVKKNIRATEGIGYDIGMTIPVKRVGRRSMWGISVHVVYNGFIWDDLNQGVGISGNYFNVSGFPDLYGATIQIGAPVGIEYKFGTDAVCSKKDRLGFTLGAGVIPTYNLTELIGVDNAGVGAGASVNPYVKAEISFFAGLCFKVRAQVSFLNVPYIDQSKNDLAFTTGPFTVSGTSETMLSFIIMPFSWHWKDKDWSNTYGQYNRWN